MEEKEFLTTMAEVLDEDENELQMNTELSSLEGWDSIAYVAYLAAMSDYTDKKILPKQVRDAGTVADLYHLAFD
ncbi:MAG: hypothetical protein MR866_06490 [Selenomonadaceae bacterium]|nr:hypothetical protein [Selenomonadaceae bacterium]